MAVLDKKRSWKARKRTWQHRATNTSVSILSCTKSNNQLSTRPSTHVEHERTEHKTSRHQQHTQTRVGALLQSHPGLCGTPVGPGKDTHGTPVPEQGRPSGGPTSSTTRRQTNDNPRKTSLKTNVLPAKPGVDTLGNFHGSGAARRSHGERAVKRNTMSTLSTS